MKLPTLEECEQLIAKYEMPANIRAHTQAVREVANKLAKNMAKNNVAVDLGVVDRGALMHDLLKMHCIKNKCRHASEAGKVLEELGYKEFGLVVKLHNLEDILLFDKSTSLEAKIIWYADKRVNHDKVVSLRERYGYLLERYGSDSEEKADEILSTQDPAYTLEKELLALAHFENSWEWAK